MFSRPLNALYEDPDKVVVTAHRGWSGRYPENTLLAFRKALALSVEMIELDLQPTADNVPIVLHDLTLDRTTDGRGSPRTCTLAEIKRLNASWWQPTFGAGYRLGEPNYADVTIPTFEEVLDLVGPSVGLNLHIKPLTEEDGAFLGEVCRLYAAHDLYEQGYLTVETFHEGELVRLIDRDIQLCVLEGAGRLTPADIQRHVAFGTRYMQPARNDVTPEFCRVARDLGMNLNMFYALSAEDHRRYLGYGLRGILTDHPDILQRTVASLGLH
ncbi:MAG: hypothetical protein GX557_07890 [Chloroflexi bacterium]|nr:hypothetical protein [Chloroflexota bacterium]